MKDEAQGISLYDLDGTILPWDTQKLFCNAVLKRFPLRRFFLPLYLCFLPFYFLLGSEGLKKVFLSFLWRLKRDEVDTLAKEFATQWFPDRCYVAMLEKIQADRSAGKVTVLVSASPEIYVRHVATILGFDYAFGTVLHEQDRFSLFPDLTNHKGWEKVRRLKKELPPEWFNEEGKLRNATGYTDSTADLPMLTLCQNAVVINPNPQLALFAEKNHWQIFYFPRPWKNSYHRAWMRLKYICGL